MKKSKKLTIERNIEVIAGDYLKASGAKDLFDLRDNYPDYYKQFLDEKNRVSGYFKKDIQEEKKLMKIPKRIGFSNLVEKTYKCKKCEERLLSTMGKIKIYYHETMHQYLNEVVKIQCPCGEQNIFKLDEENKDVMI